MGKGEDEEDWRRHKSRAGVRGEEREARMVQVCLWWWWWWVGGFGHDAFPCPPRCFPLARLFHDLPPLSQAPHHNTTAAHFSWRFSSAQRRKFCCYHRG